MELELLMPPKADGPSVCEPVEFLARARARAPPPLVGFPSTEQYESYRYLDSDTLEINCAKLTLHHEAAVSVVAAALYGEWRASTLLLLRQACSTGTASSAGTAVMLVSEVGYGGSIFPRLFHNPPSTSTLALVTLW